MAFIKGILHMTNHYKSILIAVDGSKQAEYAFRKSIDVAKRNENSKLYLVHIINTRSYEAYDRSVLERVEKEAKELLDGYKAKAEAEGLGNVHVAIDYGSPKTIITNEVASKVVADVIICGATGLNAVERFLIGSVSEAIVRTAKCDVLVIRTPE